MVTVITQTQDVVINTIDTQLELVEHVLTASADGYNYQWLDCQNDMSPIPGANEQSFSSQTSGEFAVQISNGECTVVSDCFELEGMSLGENTLLNSAYLSPNPGTR